MSFYNLPHPWDPGYAIPKYVMGEPPERGVFVTEWLPRGTIPTLVPEYFAKPGEKILGRADAELGGLGSLGGSCLGGSSLSGHTLSGHTLRGHSLGATEWSMGKRTGLSGSNGRADYGKYGQKAAAKMIAAVKRLPAGQRSDALTAAMKKLDPSLPARCQKYTAQAQAAGAGPAAALQAGLARAISEGVLGELDRVGRSRRAPHPGSLLGMGCSRARSALGATFGAAVSASQIGGATTGGGFYTTTTPPPIPPPAPAPAPTTPQTSDPRCPNPPAGFSWVAASGDIPGHWARLGRNGPAVGLPAPYVGGYPDCLPGDRGPGGGVLVDGEAAQAGQGKGPSKYLEVGPTGSGFMFPVDDADRYQVRVHSPSVIPSGWKPMIKQAWTTAKQADWLSLPAAESGGSTLGIDAATWQAQVRPWLNELGIPPGTKLNLTRMFTLMGNFPFVFKHPIDGKDWGVGVALPIHRGGPSGPLIGRFEPGSTIGPMVAAVRPTPDPNWIQRTLGAIRDAAVATGEAIKDAVEAVVDLTCDLLNTPGAAQGAAAATGGAAGAGVIIAQQTVCGQPTPTPPPPMVAPGPSYLVPLAIGGGVLLLAAAVAARRR